HLRRNRSPAVDNPVAVGLAQVYAMILAPDLQEAELERVLTLAHQIRSAVWTNMAGAALASALIRLGRIEAAADVLRPLLTEETPRRTLGQRLLWMAQAEIARQRDQPQEALDILARLYAEARNLPDEAAVPHLARLKATALAASGECAVA